MNGFVDSTLARFGRLDCAANSAGISTSGAYPMADFTSDEFERVIGINLKGVFLCMRAQIRAMLAAERGAIVNIASAAGLVGVPGMSPYVASKHAIMGLTKSAAADYAAHGIRINAVCPGLTRTPMAKVDRNKVVDKTIAAAPIGRISEPDEQAQAVLFLCSDKASYAIGHGLVIDGGYSTI